MGQMHAKLKGQSGEAPRVGSPPDCPHCAPRASDRLLDAGFYSIRARGSFYHRSLDAGFVAGLAPSVSLHDKQSALASFCITVDG